MSKILAEEDISVIDNRGKRGFPKWLRRTLLLAILILSFLFIHTLLRKAELLRDLTTGNIPVPEHIKDEDSTPVDIYSENRINLVELNGKVVDTKVSKTDIKLLYKCLPFLPDDKYDDPKKEITDAYRYFKDMVGVKKMKEFEYPPIHVKVSYSNNVAYKYSISNTLNGYSMTFLCNYHSLISQLNPILDPDGR